MERSVKDQMLLHRMDQVIYESEKETEDGSEAVDAETAFKELEKKHFYYCTVSGPKHLIVATSAQNDDIPVGIHSGRGKIWMYIEQNLIRIS